MQIPIDIGAVVAAMNGNDEARKQPISVSVYIDDSAPSDVIGLIRSLFASAATHARITLGYIGNAQAIPNPSDDAAVIVGGSHSDVGRLASDIRAAGVPAMVVTTMPSTVARIASEQGFAIPSADLIAPKVPEDEEEPVALDESNTTALKLRMGEWVIQISGDKRLAFATAFPFVCRPLGVDAVNLTALENAAIGAVLFIPGADMPVMTLNQAKMLLQIAAAYGQPMTIDRAKELAAVVAGGFAFRTVSRNLSGLIPAIGPAIKAGIGYAGTQAMGRAAIEYFENGGGISGLANTVAQARDAVMRGVSAAQVAINGEQPEPEPEPEKSFAEKATETAKVWGERASKVGSTAAKIAVPLAQSAASAGAEKAKQSLKDNIGSILPKKNA